MPPWCLDNPFHFSLSSQPPKTAAVKTAAPAAKGAAPKAAKKKLTSTEWKNERSETLFAKKPKSFGIGSPFHKKTDMTHFVKWPLQVRIQRQRAILKQRVKVPAAINQFGNTITKDQGTHSSFVLSSQSSETSGLIVGPMNLHSCAFLMQSHSRMHLYMYNSRTLHRSSCFPLLFSLVFPFSFLRSSSRTRSSCAAVRLVCCFSTDSPNYSILTTFYSFQPFPAPRCLPP